MRGDRPLIFSPPNLIVTFTPHARGSTAKRGEFCYLGSVYPACAGIDRSCITPLVTMPRLPRMRGDRPWSALEIFWSPRFTPHARGSTLVGFGDFLEPKVYPACAGIDLLIQVRLWQVVCLPRMRGDRPRKEVMTSALRMFTPHARGSTHVGGRSGHSSGVYPACAGIDRPGRV